MIAVGDIRLPSHHHSSCPAYGSVIPAARALTIRFDSNHPASEAKATGERRASSSRAPLEEIAQLPAHASSDRARNGRGDPVARGPCTRDASPPLPSHPAEIHRSIA